MLEFKGTPMPWVVDNTHPHETIIDIRCGDCNNWANFTTYNAKDKETQMANAHLIAAAPELLEALQMVVIDAELRNIENKIIYRCKQAISKALGEGEVSNA